MAISNELSTDIATALLTAKNRSPRELKHLRELVIKIHSTLQRLADQSKTARRVSKRLDNVLLMKAAGREYSK